MGTRCPSMAYTVPEGDMMMRRWILGALVVLAAGCDGEDPPLEDAGVPDSSSECESGTEYDSYYCCMQIVGDDAYCSALTPPEPPFDLGEAAPAQIGDSFPAAETGPPP